MTEIKSQSVTALIAEERERAYKVCINKSFTRHSHFFSPWQVTFANVQPDLINCFLEPVVTNVYQCRTIG